MSTTPLTLSEFPSNNFQDWRQAAEESLKGAPFEKKLVTRTHEGIDLQPIYTPENSESIPEAWPGLAPYLRGTNAGGPRIKPWLIAQEFATGDPADFNRQIRADLARGQTSINLVLDHSTRLLLNPGEEKNCGTDLRGLSLFRLSDLESALEGIDLSKFPLLCFAGSSAIPLLGQLSALAEKSGVPLSSLQGSILADPLTEWAGEGSLPISLEDAATDMTESIQWAIETGCPLRLVGVQASIWGDCGATAVEELAFATATGAEYLRTLTTAGISVSQATDRFAFSFALGSQIFMQIAKIRAARLLWWKVTSAFGAEGKMWIHARSSTFNKSALDPHTNLLRSTAEAFAGGVSGVDSMHVSAFDEPIRLPDTTSRRHARNAQVILLEECGLGDLADASGGSWYVETLTLQLAELAWKKFQEIEAKGGMASALREGIPQAACAASAKKKLSASATRRDGYIGVNLFPDTSEVPLDPKPAEQNAFRTDRTQEAAKLQKSASALTEMHPKVQEIAAAWKSGATAASIRKAIKRNGEAAPAIAKLQLRNASEAFEELRSNARAYSAANGTPPKIWLANFGPPKQHKLRADFCLGFLSPGGFSVLQGPGAKTPAEAAEAAAKSGALATIVCSSDDTYPEIVPAFIEALRATGSTMPVILAGFPQDHIESLTKAGVQHFVHMRVNCLEFNHQLQTQFGIA